MLSSVTHGGSVTGRERQDGPGHGTQSGVELVFDRQVSLFAVAVVVVAAPSLAVQLTTHPPAVSSPEPAWAEDYFEQVHSAVERYNNRVEDLYRVEIWDLNLKQARNVIRNERVNVYVTGGASGTAAFSFRLDENARIRDLSQDRRADATVRVVVDRSAVERIKGEYTQTRAVRDAYLQNDIRVTGLGVNNWLQWWLVDQWVHHVLTG